MGALNPQMELNSITHYESRVLLSDGVGELNSSTLMAIMLSNRSGCSEVPNPSGYHVE